MRGRDNNYVTVRKINRFGTTVLILLIAAYLVITITGINRLVYQIDVVSEHSFEISRTVNEIRLDISMIQVKTEGLQAHNSVEDVQRTEAFLQRVYNNAELLFGTVQKRYLGPPEDVNAFTSAYREMKNQMEQFLLYAESGDRSIQQVHTYEKKYLEPIYEKFNAAGNIILEFANQEQMDAKEYAGNLKKNTYFWSLMIAGVFLCGWFVFQFIITELNQSIYEKNRHFDILAHTIDETFLIFDKKEDGCIYVSGNIASVLGLDSHTVMEDRSAFYQYVLEEDGKKIRDYIYAENPELPWSITIRYDHPYDRQEHILHVRFYGMKEDRTGGAYIATVSDQTQAVRAKTALEDALAAAEHANNAKRDFLSRMSHEIRTPMNAIIGMATIASANAGSVTKVQNCLEKIGQASKHLLMLINDVLDMSRIESSKMLLHSEPFDMDQFVNSLLSIIYVQAQQKGIEFKEKMLGFDSNRTYVGDTMRLNQILLNLVSNAVKFTDTGGTIELGIERIPLNESWDRLIFTVSDTGIGMDEKGIASLYSPFEQADSSISQKYGGTGLGMSIARNLISLMDGHIDVKSKLGQGTVFTVELKLERSQITVEGEESKALGYLNVLIADDENGSVDCAGSGKEGEHALQGKRILMAEDNELNMEIAVELLRLNGAGEVSCARDGQEAVDMFCRAQPGTFDVILMDIQMPVKTGYEAVAEIRNSAHPEAHSIPIIAITANAFSDDISAAITAGMNAHVSKPIDMGILCKVLKQVTGSR